MAAKPNVARLFSCFASGTDSTVTLIEVSISPGIPTFSVIGLCDPSIKESHGRLISAFKSTGFNMPKGHITVAISPAYLRKTGSGFDLAMALGILFASGQLYMPPEAKIYAEGELTLGGDLKGTPGSCIRLKTVRDMDFDYKIIPRSEACSAGIAGFTGQGITSLSDLSDIFDGNNYKEAGFEYECADPAEDFIDISALKGQEKTKRALLISAAGFHNIMLMGSPGSGKTMVGKILSGILPKLSPSEMSDVYSLTELVEGDMPLPSTERPVRMIGPDVTVSKLIGNSLTLTPGEMALANHGILFADELPLFKSEVLDFLRSPLEERKVRLMKKGVLYSFDADLIFLGTGNPCKCGMLYEKDNKCKCSRADVRRYLMRINGPFLERIDIFSEMRSISGLDMASIYIDEKRSESLEYRKTVERCWKTAHERYGDGTLNGTFPEGDIRDSMRIPESVIRYASDLSGKGFFSARGFTRILRVARTIADISDTPDVTEADVSEAIHYRSRIV
ncbi:MAG: ATP-binding protein [Clostridiales bacterium]|nr:ATP-binding protein [Clostridiales bacterium]